MSRAKTKNKSEAMGMVATMLLSTVLSGALLSADGSMLPRAAEGLPFALPAKINDMALAPFSMAAGVLLAALALAVLPAAQSRKKILLGGFLLLVTAAIMAVFVTSPFQLACWSFIGGIGWTLHFCAWVSIGSAYFPRHCAMVVACMNFVTMAGGIVGPKLTAIVHARHAGRELPLLPALAGILVLLFLFLLILHLFKQISGADRQPVISPVAHSAAVSHWSRAPLMLALAVLCLVLATFGYTGSYQSFLCEVQGFPLKSAGLATGMFGLGVFLSPVGAWLGDRLGHFKVLLIAAPLACMVGALLYLPGGLPMPVIMLLSFLAGFALYGVFYINVYAAVINAVAPAQSMRAMGLLSAVYTLPTVFPHDLISGSQYTLGWNGVFLLQVAAPMLLATVMIWLARNTLELRGKEKRQGRRS